MSSVRPSLVYDSTCLCQWLSFCIMKQSTTATSRHRCYMTSDVFKKATLNQNKQTSDTHNKMADDQKKEIHFVLISNVY